MAAAQTPVQVVWWIVGSLAVIIALLGFLVFVFWRKGAAGSGARPTSHLRAAGACGGDSLSVEDWKRRALEAEAMAGRQGQMLRKKIMPELTEFAKQSLVQGLYAQRNALMEGNKRRNKPSPNLNRGWRPFNCRSRSAFALMKSASSNSKKEVETQGEEMRELTRATLVLVRKKLEDEQEHERTQRRFN